MATVQAGVRSAPWVPAAVCGCAGVFLLGAGFAGGAHGAPLFVTPVSLSLLGVLLALRRRLDRLDNLEVRR